MWKSGIPESDYEENRTGKDGISGRISFSGVPGSRADICTEAEPGKKKQSDSVRYSRIREVESESTGDGEQINVQEVEMEELKVISVERTSLVKVEPVRKQKHQRKQRTSLSEIVTWCLIGVGIGSWLMLLLCLA